MDADTLPAWADHDAVLTDALDVLRLTATDPDAERVSACVDAAITLVDHFLDRDDTDPLPGPPPPDAVQRGCVQVTVELYRRKDAPFGVLDAWSPDGPGPLRIGNDPMARVYGLLLPHRRLWGIA